MNTRVWHHWFAWRPVMVDAFEPGEIVNGKMRYRKWLCWVERIWDTWIDIEEGINHAAWRYRPARSPASPPREAPHE